MASYSSKYLTGKNKDGRTINESSSSEEALQYSTTVELVDLLIGNEPGLDRLPVIYDLEGTA